MRHLIPLLVFAILALTGSSAPNGPTVSLTPLQDRVQVEIGGQLFTEYIYGDGAKRPYLYPILAADGTPLTRDFPMKDTPGEEHDHPHHRSLWFAHSSVNGIDFWNEGTAGGSAPSTKGSIVHDTLALSMDGTTGVIRTTNRWLSPAGQLVCTDETDIRFHATAAGRFIDYAVTLHALPDAPLVLGDNKDGTMAIRLAQWMTLPHTYMKQKVAGSGHIVTGAGEHDAAAWGQRAAWCDYAAPHLGRTYGVTLFDHPKNLRFPTWWMARDYGLFAANPFGQHDFEGLKDQPHAGDYTIPAGGSLTLNYRFFFHVGEASAAELEAQSRAFIAGN